MSFVIPSGGRIVRQADDLAESRNLLSCPGPPRPECHRQQLALRAESRRVSPLLLDLEFHDRIPLGLCERCLRFGRPAFKRRLSQPERIHAFGS